MKSTPSVTIETVTPDRARQLLEHNPHNRKLRPRHVGYLVGELAGGRWELTNDAVTVTADGTLTNGQHRLEAIITADRPAQLTVLTGASFDAQLASDIGNRRSLPDALEIAGFSNLVPSAAVITFVFRMSDPELSYAQTHHMKYAYVTQVEFAKQNAEKLQEAVAISRHVRLAVRFPGSIIGGLWYLQDEIDPEDAGGFWDGVVSLAELGETDARLVWRKWADRQNNIRGTAYTPQIQKVALTIKAWNLWRDGTPVQTLTYRAGGVHAETFPELR